MSEQKQKQHTGTPITSRSPLEQGSDDQAAHLLESAKKLQKKAEGITKEVIDPRRSMTIDVEFGPTRSMLYINGTLWAEVDWSTARGEFCIQDCYGYCLSHVEHVVATVPYPIKNTENRNPNPIKNHEDSLCTGMDKAIEVAKQMIRDGTMRSPEDAKQFAIKNNTSARRHYDF